MKKNYKVLCVSNDVSVLDSVKQLSKEFNIDILKDNFHNIVTMPFNDIDIVILDSECLGDFTTGLAKKIYTLYPKISIILLGEKNPEFSQQVLELNFAKFIIKSECYNSLREELMHFFDNDNFLYCDASKQLYFFNEKDFFDLKYKILMLNKKEIYLNHNERKLLFLLVKNAHRVVKYKEIAAYIWNDEYKNEAISSLVSKLRKKLGGILIKNESREGYKIN